MQSNKAARPMMEALEQRQLMSATVASTSTPSILLLHAKGVVEHAAHSVGSSTTIQAMTGLAPVQTVATLARDRHRARPPQPPRVDRAGATAARRRPPSSRDPTAPSR